MTRDSAGRRHESWPIEEGDLDEGVSLDLEGIQSLLPERPPTLSLRSGRVWRVRARLHTGYYSRCEGAVPVALCEGHFPGRPIAPLVALGLMGGQACCLAAAVGQHEVLSLGIGEVGRVRLLSRTPIPPGIDLVAEGLVRQGHFGVWKGRARITRDGLPILVAEDVLCVPLQLDSI